MIALVIFKRFISHRNKGNTNQENTTCKRSLAYRYYNQYFARNRCFYEIIEWLSTRISKGSKGAKDFLGMQGDRWDAQWDMFLALLGAILTLLLFTKLHDKFLKRINKS